MALVVRKQQWKGKGWSKGNSARPNDKGTWKGKGKWETTICVNCGAEDHVEVSQRPVPQACRRGLPSALLLLQEARAPVVEVPEPQGGPACQGRGARAGGR